MRAAIDRLGDHGYAVAAGEPTAGAGTRSTAVVRTEDGVAVELTVEVTTAGALLLHAGAYTERADSTLAALRGAAMSRSSLRRDQPGEDPVAFRPQISSRDCCELSLRL